MVDNIKPIRDLLTFPDDDTFYFLQILRRKKDNEDNKSNAMVMGQYSITSLSDFDYNVPLIKAICDSTNSRAYINLNPRSIELAALKTNTKIGKQLENKSYISVKNAYQSVCGSLGIKKGCKKTWVIDCDEMTLEETKDLGESFKEKLPVGNKIKAVLPTHSGYHLITSPFDCRNISISTKEIHKNRPTLLYYYADNNT